jgi:hypothetical protein
VACRGFKTKYWHIESLFPSVIVCVENVLKGNLYSHGQK